MISKNLKALVPGALLFCSGLAHAATGLPWSSGFETGDWSDWGRSVSNDTGMSVTTEAEARQAGSYGVKIPLRANYINDNYAERPFGDHPAYDGGRGDAVDEVWLSFRVKFVPDAGYDHSNFWISRSSHKIALINFEDSSNQRRNQVYLYINRDGRFRADWSDIDSWRFDGLEPVGTSPQVEFGKWHKVKLHVKRSSTGVADGAVQLWVDNQLVIDQQAYMTQNHNVSPNLLLLSSYTGMRDGGAGTQYMDSWYLDTVNPEDAPPGAPVLRLSR